jgi:AcrR family transcriptional regulator
MKQNKITNAHDMRVRRTRKRLYNALADLMKHKPFDAISVVDVCERAMIHRTTFYAHFVDKHDLLRDAIAERQQEFVQKSLSLNAFSTISEFYADLFRKVALYLSEKRPLFASSDTRNNGLEIQIARRTLTEGIKTHLGQRRPGQQINGVPVEIEARCIAGALLSLATWWIEENQPVPLEQLCSYVRRLIRSDNAPA